RYDLWRHPGILGQYAARNGIAQFTVEAADDRPAANGDAIGNRIADGRLQAHDLDPALEAMKTALETAFIIGFHAKRHIEAEAGRPFVAQWLGVIGKGHEFAWHHVAIIGAREKAL